MSASTGTDARYQDSTRSNQNVFEKLACDATVRALVVNGPAGPLSWAVAEQERVASASRPSGCEVSVTGPVSNAGRSGWEDQLARGAGCHPKYRDEGD